MNTSKDFPEDFSKNNGCYSNMCSHCNNIFYGYKRRILCKECESMSNSVKEFKVGSMVRVLTDTYSTIPKHSICEIIEVDEHGCEVRWDKGVFDLYYIFSAITTDLDKQYFKPNDVVRYIGESSTFSLDTDKLYVVNSSEMYGGALYVADDICAENYLISNKPEMFTLIYRENV